MFGSTSCGKCENNSFKLQEISPVGAAYKSYAIQCSSCKTSIGTTDNFNVGSLFLKQEKAIADLESKMDVMARSINQIEYVLNQWMRR
jgi:hypothetical protein